MTSLTSLALEGPLNARRVEAFLGAFPSDVSLSLVGSQSDDNEDDSDDVAAGIEAVVATATRLESLALGPYTFSDPSLAFLRNLTPKTLAFSDIFAISAADLLAHLSCLSDADKPKRLSVVDWAHSEKRYPVPDWPEAFSYREACLVR